MSLDPQLHYLDGLMLADPIYRHDWSQDVREFFRAAGGDSLGFWRGVVEGSTRIGLKLNGSPYPSPRVELTGSPFFLAAILEWTYDMHPGYDRVMLAYRQCPLGKVLIRGTRGLQFVQFFWPDVHAFGKASYRRDAALIRDWRPGGGPLCGRQNVSDLVDLRTIDAMRRIEPRGEYKMTAEQLGAR